MYYILLAGAILNYLGALKMLKEVRDASSDTSYPEEYLQLKYFVIGVAATFGTIYLYLFFNREYLIPFLIFGAALKVWAYITCQYLYIDNKIAFRRFFEFGIECVSS